ncbi:MAG: EAL domain-containing protein [Pseudomonadota bacterium]
MSNEKVLVVEDENIVALDLKRRLKKLGYDVIGMASNANRALNLVEEHVPDIVLMDIHIQGNTDGIEIARILYEKYSIPVIFLTAYSEEATLLRAKKSKPYGYLLKPFSERELHAGIQVALEKSQADRKIRNNQVHLQLALEAGNFHTWETSSGDENVILSYTSGGRVSDVTDWPSLLQQIVPEDRAKVFHRIESIKHAANLEIEMDFEILDPDIGHRWLAMFGKSHQMDSGIKIVGVLQDITERRLVEDNLKQAASVYRCSADGIVILDSQMKVISANTAFARITGYQSESAIGSELNFLAEKTIGNKLAIQIKSEVETHGFWQGEIKTYRANHEFLYAWVNIGKIPDTVSTLGQFVVVISDITEIRDTQEKLSRIAYYDALTNLPNRNLFMDRLEIAMAKAKRDSKELAILFLDLDHFKRINDTLGHQVGDIMLKAVANRLKSQIRAVDTLCRIGGDEFIVIIDRFSALEDLAVIANKLLDSLRVPLKLGSTEVIPNASIGISIYPVDSRNKDDLIKMADTAMYFSKNSGRSRYAFYKQEMTIKAEHYLQREHELRYALQHNQLLMHYQPQCNAVTKTIVGLEALIRWQHPELGLVCALEIIPVAETSDLIISVGNWVIDEVCRQCEEWFKAGTVIERVAINVSPRQLQDNQFVGVLAAALQRHKIAPHVIEVEITESCLQDNEACIRSLTQLEKLGVTISIDDFGTGYSCLSSLRTLPIHRLKIDQAFVRDIPEDDSACAIASAIVALSQQLKLEVIAEGIETIEQAEFMKSIGCQELQGYLFSRPVPANEIVSLVSHDRARLISS